MNLSPASKNLIIMLLVYMHLEQNIIQQWYLAKRTFDS